MESETAAETKNVARDPETFHPRINEVNQKFIADLMEEKERLGEEFPLCALLIDEALERVTLTGRIPGKEFYADVFKQKPLKVVQKVFVPTRQYSKFNFIGKILGPKGNCLRRLQDETQCRIALKGRNSIRDNAKEEELRNSGDPRFAHLHKDFFVEICTVATPAESYARIAYALAEIRKYIIPDKNDEVSQEQMREMIEINPESTKTIPFAKYKSILDRKQEGNSGGASKYLNLIRKTSFNPHLERAAYEQEVEEEEVYEHHEHPKQYVPKRHIATYEYAKVRPYMSPLKRPQPTVYATEMKRVRESPSTSYKPKSYSILNKYK